MSARVCTVVDLVLVAGPGCGLRPRRDCALARLAASWLCSWSRARFASTSAGFSVGLDDQGPAVQVQWRVSSRLPAAPQTSAQALISPLHIPSCTVALLARPICHRISHVANTIIALRPPMNARTPDADRSCLPTRLRALALEPLHMPLDAAAGVSMDQCPRRDIVGQAGWDAALPSSKRGAVAVHSCIRAVVALVPCHRAVAKRYEVSFFGLCRTLRQDLCTGRMDLRAGCLGCLCGTPSGGTVGSQGGRGGDPRLECGMRSHSLTHPVNPPDSPSPSRLTRPATCPSPRHPAGSEAGRIWHLPSPIRAVRARAINHHPVSITQTLYMDRANTRLPTSRTKGHDEPQLPAVRRRGGGRGWWAQTQTTQPIHTRRRTPSDLTTAATAPSSETMHCLVQGRH